MANEEGEDSGSSIEEVKDGAGRESDGFTLVLCKSREQGIK